MEYYIGLNGGIIIKKYLKNVNMILEIVKGDEELAC